MKTKSNTVQISNQQISNYLDKSVIEEFAHLKIKSDDGQHIQINHLLWIACSTFPRELLKDIFNESPKDMIISSEFSFDELKILQDFMMSGHLPFSEVGKIPIEINSMFLAFGINIKLILSQQFFPSSQVKIEQKDNDKFAYDIMQPQNKQQSRPQNRGNSIPKIKGNRNDSQILSEENEHEKICEDPLQYSIAPYLQYSKKDMSLVGREKLGNEVVDNILENYEKILITKAESNNIFAIESHRKSEKTSKDDKGNKNYNCDSCGKSFGYLKSLTKHQTKPCLLKQLKSDKTKNNGDKCSKTSNFMCGSCGRSFTKTGDLNKHIQTVHEGHIDHKCEFCGKSYTKASGLIRHILTVHNNNNKDFKCVYKCESCAKVFNRLDVLKIHIKRIHEDHRDYKCESCDKSFTQVGSLKKHIKKIHEGHNHNAFTCELCGKVFSDKGNLQYHFKGVHEVEEVKCDNCGVVCKNKYSLMVHMKTHRKTPCSFCGNMLSAGTLKKHIRSKHTANHLQPHQCQTCKKGFSTAKRLEMHMNIHTGARPFLCKYCRKSYAHVGNCRMHERTAHEGYKRTDKRK